MSRDITIRRSNTSRTLTFVHTHAPLQATIAAATTMSAGATMRARDDPNDVPAHLLCCVCFDAPSARVESCPNGHILCAEGDSCLAKLRAHASGLSTTAKCPLCCCVLPARLTRCLNAEHSIALLPAACRHGGEGSHTQGNLAAHEAACPSAPSARCAAAAEGCAWKGRASGIAAH